MSDNTRGITDRKDEEAWIRLTMAAMIAMLFGVVWAFMLNINVTLGSGVSMILVTGIAAVLTASRD
jgi:hypothetical protein